MIGFIFMNRYEQTTMMANQESLDLQAVRIANRVSILYRNNDKKGFDAYLEVLKSTQDTNTDVWIVSNTEGKNPMPSEFTNANISDINISESASEILVSAFNGIQKNNRGYDKTYEMPMIRTATPIYDAGGNVSGAVLIFFLVQSQRDIIDSSKSLILTSTLGALIISFVIAILFARQISNPITKMRETANELVRGNYSAKTKIKQKDEIGDLADTLDILSERLLKSEKEREDMEQMRRDFFANVSHELRTPITVMRGYTELLVDDVVTDEKKKFQYYERMLLECQSMERLVGDLLILSKLQNPDFEIEKEPINLVQVFEEIIRTAKMMAVDKELTIHFERDSDYYMILGDYGRLRQMFLIILDNAIKFSNIGGNVYINITNMDKIVVSIKDEGIGISEEELPYIFEKFYKSKLRQNAKGSGLGLVIAKQIAIRHGGDIHVESQVGNGTIFQFFFDKCEVEVL